MTLQSETYSKNLNGSMNCANSLKPLVGVLGSECVLTAWAE